MGDRRLMPAWLRPTLSDVPHESWKAARSRLAGQARARNLSPARLSQIGRKGGRAAMAKLSPEERTQRASHAGRIANAQRWGWAAFTLSAAPTLPHLSFVALGVLEDTPDGMFPMQLVRATDGEVSVGSAYCVIAQLLVAGQVVKREGVKNRWGRPLYEITDAGRWALASMRALIVEAPQ